VPLCDERSNFTLDANDLSHDTTAHNVTPPTQVKYTELSLSPPVFLVVLAPRSAAERRVRLAHRPRSQLPIRSGDGRRTDGSGRELGYLQVSASGVLTCATQVFLASVPRSR
jgi:hypothetical protein